MYLLSATEYNQVRRRLSKVTGGRERGLPAPDRRKPGANESLIKKIDIHSGGIIMAFDNEYQQPSPIIRLWEEYQLKEDFTRLMQDPYGWIAEELKKSETRRSHGPSAEKYHVLMEIFDILNGLE